jgi:hypothetical protein
MAFILRSNRLALEIAEPEELTGFTRFDRSAFIKKITLDGKHQFCAAEPGGLSHFSTGGEGLCHEFKTDAIANDTLVGEVFPKFGVGLLTKPDNKPYAFHRLYECKPFKTDYSHTENTAVFHTYPEICNGYALDVKRTITVSENTVLLETTLTNTGEKELNLREYCHNFVTIDALPTSGAYQLTFPTVKPVSLKSGEEGTMFAQGQVLSFNGHSEKPSFIALDSDCILKENFRWELTHRDSPARISEACSFIPEAVFVWAVDYIISPEIFYGVCLRPGNTEHFTRKWVFTN